jgi:4-amino-4-deoxy-L-arabinose transferase-like glycosyltransferase
MKRWIWIVLIVLLAGFLRFYRLTEVPPALNSDEVAIGYNAYSILTTGRDEYGIQYPLTFRSFDDYKMPVYVYMVAGSMKVFGYNDFAVRFPSALLGTLTVLVTYFFVKKLFSKWDNKRSRNVALIASFLLAISPWSLQFSRAGYEANVAVFFVALGAHLFLVGLQKGWALVLSSVVFSLAIWTYLSARIFVPLLIAGFAVVYAKELWTKKTAVGLSTLLAVILLLPIIKLSLSSQGQMRASGVSAFANSDDLKISVSRIALDKAKGLGVFTIFDNRRVIYAVTFLRGYLSHFDPNFLFLDKSIDKYRAPDVGLLYLFELPLLLAGIYMLVRKWDSASAALCWWILVAPVAAAFTLQLPHPVRTLVFLPTFQIVSAIGLMTIWDKIRYARIAVFLIILLSFVYYLHQYFIVLPVEDAKYWYTGRREMTQKINTLKSSYDIVYVSNSLDFPYIFYLYYSRVDPLVYLRQGGTVSGGFEEQRNHVGNIQFRSINTSLLDPEKKILFVGLPTEAFTRWIVDTVYYPDGTPAIKFFK